MGDIVHEIPQLRIGRTPDIGVAVEVSHPSGILLSSSQEGADGRDWQADPADPGRTRTGGAATGATTGATTGAAPGRTQAEAPTRVAREVTEGALAGGRTPPTRLASRLLCGVAAVVALGLVGEAIWPAPAYANAGERIVGLFAAAFVTVSMAVCLSVVAVGFSMTVFEAAAGLVRGGARVIDRRLHPPPPPEPVAPEPEVVEFWSPTPIEGWRLWVWNGSELKGYWQYWPRSSLVSKCVKCAEVPGEDHRCGVNAYKERSQIPARFHVDEGESVVHGRVLLTGLVIEHELGYRAERARIAELFVAADISDAVQARYPDVVVTRHHPLPPDQEYGDW